MASVAGMDITINAGVLPHIDPEASLAFYRDILGFEVRGDVGHGEMRWITVGPVGRRLRLPRPRGEHGPHPAEAMIRTATDPLPLLAAIK